MKLLTSPRSYWNRSLFRATLFAALGLWATLQLPLLLVFYVIRSDQQIKALHERRVVIESILLNSIEQGSRFGDIVNTRGQALELGSPLGLLDIGICQGGADILARLNDERCKSGEQGSTHSLELSGEKVEVRFYWKPFVPSFLTTVGTIAILSTTFSLMIILLLVLMIFSVISRRVRGISDRLSDLSGDAGAVELGDYGPEFKKLTVAIGSLRDRISKYHQTNQELASRAAISDLASQVSHDIRSPLSALNMVMGTLDALPEEKRVLIQVATRRINDIANELLNQSKKSLQQPIKNWKEPILIMETLDSIVSEKRMQYRESDRIEILGDLRQSYGYFALLDLSDFSRAVSNVINNSVESLDGVGRVTVSADSSDGNVLIRISDNGKGISDSVLTQIGQHGFSSGKVGSGSGSGLGLNQAITSTKRVGGELSIRSKIGSGTDVIFSFPRIPAPSWFPENITLQKGARLISVDDDPSIHGVWDNRLRVNVSSTHVITHLKFLNLNEFVDWFKVSSKPEDIFLIDLEFAGQSENGIDLIESLAISARSILVTSRSEDPYIRSRSTDLGVKLLAKRCAEYIPIIFEN